MFNKRLLVKLIVFNLVVVLPTILYILFYVYPWNKNKEIVEADEPISAFEELTKPIHFEPKKLMFDSLNTVVDVVNVGVTEEGVMETPKEWNMAGWYMRSSEVGDEGNLVINGHYDDMYGNPATFYQLKNLREGDKVLVVDKLNRVYVYKIIDSFFLEIDDPNRFNIINKTDNAELTLITCGGIWNLEKGTYDKRLVVKGELL